MATLATRGGGYAASSFNPRVLSTTPASGRSHPQPSARSHLAVRAGLAPPPHAHNRSQVVPRAAASVFEDGRGDDGCSTLYAEASSESESTSERVTPLDALSTPHEASLEATGEPARKLTASDTLLARLHKWMAMRNSALVVVAVVGTLALTTAGGAVLMPQQFESLVEAARTQLDAGYAALEPFLTVQMALSTAPLFFSFLLQSSGLPTMLTIAREKNTGERSAMPYVAMLANCCVWTVYGALRADATCMLVNGLGAVFGSLYTLTFALHTQQPMRAYFALLVALVGGVSAAALLFEQAAAPTIGIVGAFVCIVMLASPLATVRDVLATKSTASMPFAMTVAGFLNACSWAAYGLVVAHDPMMYIPNGLGLLAGLAQLSLFARFGVGAPAVQEPLVASKMH